MLRLVISLKTRAWGHLCESDDHIFQDINIIFREDIQPKVHSEQLKDDKTVGLF